MSSMEICLLIIVLLVCWLIVVLKDNKSLKDKELTQDFGTIVIDDLSDDIPHLFLELNTPIEELEKMDEVKFKVVKKNYVSQK